MTTVLFRKALAAAVAGAAVVSVSAYSSPDVHGVQDAGNSSALTNARTTVDVPATLTADVPATLTADVPATLSADERLFIRTNSDGTITAEQYSDGMSRRWNALMKNRSGDLPAQAPIEYWDRSTRAPDLG
jgi:hypothetical protein